MTTDTFRRHARACIDVTIHQSYGSLSDRRQRAMFEFVYGVCLYYVFVKAERHIGWYAQRSRIRWALWFVALGAALLIGFEESQGGFQLPRVLVAGVPAFVLVLAALLLERVYGVNAKSNIFFLVGQSSYILYLIHPYVIYGLLRTTSSRRGHLPLSATIGLLIALLLLSTVAAIAIHLWFEKPIMAVLRRRLLPGRLGILHATSVPHDCTQRSQAVRPSSSSFA